MHGQNEGKPLPSPQVAREAEQPDFETFGRRIHLIADILSPQGFEGMASDSSELDAASETEKLDSAADRLEQFERHRALLFSIAYRMLGSVADAEDIIQDSFVRWQQSSEKEIESPRAFLVTIVSRLCLNYMQSARARREEYFGQWLPEPLLTQDSSDMLNSRVDGSLSMAFLVLLERLSPVERAVFLLREVFEYEYEEIGHMLGQSVPNCRQILRRARQRIKEERPRFDASPQQHERLLNEFLEASSHGDMQGLLTLFTNDIVLYSDGGGKASAVPNPIFGADRVARFLIGGFRKFVPSDVVQKIVPLNGRPALVNYRNGIPRGVVTLEIVDGRVRNIYIVTNPKKLERLPQLPALPC
jgi:RNA polymerase sigma-70 factor, ECF subfamily